MAALQNAGNVSKAGDVKMKIPQGVRDTAHAHGKVFFNTNIY